MGKAFDEVYKAAKEGEITKLHLLKEKYSTLDTFRGDNAPIIQATMEGCFASVEVLLMEGASIDCAVRGAAAGGHFEFARELMQRGASKNYAVYGAAQGGHFQFAEELIKQGAEKHSAVKGAARGGHVDFVVKLLKEGASLDHAVIGAAIGGHFKFTRILMKLGKRQQDNNAVKGAAQGGHFEFVEELIKEGASKRAAVFGMSVGGHFYDESSAIYIFSYFQGLEFRELLLKSATTQVLSYKIENVLSQAKKISQLTRKRHLSPLEAKAWLDSEDLRNFFLCFAHNLFNLSLELYMHIGSFLAVRLNETQLMNLYNTQRFNVFAKNPILNDLEVGRNSFWSHHKERTNNLVWDLHYNTPDLVTLNERLKTEVEIFKSTRPSRKRKSPDYPTIIEYHHERCRKLF